MSTTGTGRGEPDSAATLAQWLSWLETLHPREIDLSLQRVSRVAERAGLIDAGRPVIIVGGTNGKGSTVARLANIYHVAGYRTGAYYSPHISCFNERIQIARRQLDDAAIVAALQRVRDALAEETLTYFEFTTLAAMRLFIDHDVDVVILEVGLGGRLDATNLWDADCAIITSIALDHQAWLGADRDSIGREKIAIGRRGRPMIIGEPDLPDSTLRDAAARGLDVVRIDDTLTLPSLVLAPHERRNIACVLAALDALADRLPVSEAARRRGLTASRPAGRFERLIVDGQAVILDVAHNPAAAAALADALQVHGVGTPLSVVFGILSDKDVDGVIGALAPLVARWYCAGLPVSRSLDPYLLAAAVRQHGAVLTSGAPVVMLDSIGRAWSEASAAPTGTVLVTGSFHTLAAVHEHWQCQRSVVVAAGQDDG